MAKVVVERTDLRAYCSFCTYYREYYDEWVDVGPYPFKGVPGLFDDGIVIDCVASFSCRFATSLEEAQRECSFYEYQVFLKEYLDLEAEKLEHKYDEYEEMVAEVTERRPIRSNCLFRA